MNYDELCSLDMLCTLLMTFDLSVVVFPFRHSSRGCFGRVESLYVFDALMIFDLLSVLLVKGRVCICF